MYVKLTKQEALQFLTAAENDSQVFDMMHFIKRKRAISPRQLKKLQKEIRRTKDPRSE
jgi:hypothetical protein